MDETKLKEFSEKLKALLEEYGVTLGVEQRITINPQRSVVSKEENAGTDEKIAEPTSEVIGTE